MKQKLSILDIARALAVSPTTVSFILNGKAKEKRISEKLEKEVLEYVEKTGYKPNSLARSLRTGKTNTIGLVVESIANPFFANIARAIEEKAYQNGYRILYSSTGNSVGRTKEILNTLRDQHVDGYIISPPPGLESAVQELVDSGKPVVLFDRNLPGIKVDSISIDNFESMHEATKQLVIEGFQKVALVTLDSTQSQMLDRRKGYEKCLITAGLPKIILEVTFTQSQNEMTKAIQEFLSQNSDIDSLLFSTNYLAVSGLRAVRSLGKRIPEDFGIIAFDDHDVFDLYNPSITAIAQPITEIAESLMIRLIKRLDEDDAAIQGAEKIMLPGQLIVRASSKSKVKYE